VTKKDIIQQVPIIFQEEYADVPDDVIALLWNVFSKKYEHESAKLFEEKMMSRSI
jgi:hypothetical protein